MGALLQKQQDANRTVYIHRQNNPDVQNNQVETTKYTWYSFLPKAIVLQFIRPANFVYLISAILQSIRAISSLNPITAIAPFVFVIGISLIREGYEDYKRYKKDKIINQRKTRRLINGQFVQIQWQELKVGDIIKVTINQTIPADFILLSTSQQHSLCFVQTANLDGESNLKTKFAFVEDFPVSVKDYGKLCGKLTVDRPNSNLHEFTGVAKLQSSNMPSTHSTNIMGSTNNYINLNSNSDDKSKNEDGCHYDSGLFRQYNLDFDNFMLRQTVLKNTQQVIGIVIYTGYDTKIIKNQGHAINKVSDVQYKVNIIQGVLLVILFLLAASCAIGYNMIHNVYVKRENLTYLRPQVDNYSLQVFLIYLSSFLLLTFLIPISLNVSIEVIKGFLGIMLGFDKKMYYQPINKGCSVNNVSILQQLGQIDYVLTDKTGTLTANQMVFKHLSVGDQCYNAAQIKQNIYKYKDIQEFHKFWLALLICQDVVREPQSKVYQGSSPDEVCFITYASTIGYQFIKRTKNSIQFNILGKQISYQLLGILPFDSRKRMSVLVKNKQNSKIYIYVKGADSAILSNAVHSPSEHNIKANINRFARQGYRTLLFSYRQIPLNEYEILQEQKYKIRVLKAAKKQTKQAIQKLQQELVQKYESKLQLIGATAIEDRLQDQVPETISRLEEAGVIVMMITGDKLQTAENIGYLASFIKEDSKVYRFQANISEQKIAELIQEVTQQNRNTSKKQSSISVIIEGNTISKFIHSENKRNAQMLNTVNSVIFCRSSPKQKGLIVKFVKQKLKGIVLAIGDGGNDVGMIQVANVGVGILGKQGNSASAASDFSIGQFKYLDRLMLHHGRWFYYRLSYFFVYYGWKNLIMTLLLYFFMIESGFSAFSGLSQPFIGVYNVVIGLILVVYFSVFQQDINDDQYRPAYKLLPQFYKQFKLMHLISRVRYVVWSVFAILMAIFFYITARFGLGTYYAIDSSGHVGGYNHNSQALAISLSFVIIMVLISDIKMYTAFSAVIIILILTVLLTLTFFLVESFTQFYMFGQNTNYLVLQKTSFRFWMVVLVNIGVAYATKMTIDGLKLLKGQNLVQRTIRNKMNQKKRAKSSKIKPLKQQRQSQQAKKNQSGKSTQPLNANKMQESRIPSEIYLGAGVGEELQQRTS